MKILLIFFTAVFIFLAGCSKDDKPVTQKEQQKNQQDDSDNPADTFMTAEEKFSSALMFDLAGDSDVDDDLVDFLETYVYQMSLAYNGVSIVEISPAVWLLMFERDGNVKNYVLQKFMDIKSNDYYFRLKETNLTITDIIGKSNNKIPAGE